MKITVIGCGRWGTFIAHYLDSIGHDVSLYGRSTSPRMGELLAVRSNGYLTLSDTVALTTDITSAGQCDVIVISVGSQALRQLLTELKPLDISDKTIVLCMKGLETSTCMRLSEVVRDVLGEIKTAVWLGPGHVQEFLRGVPNCMVIDSDDEEVKERLVSAFSSNTIRFYYGCDLIGNEIGAAAKNVIGIAAGVLDGLGLTSLKGALMSRGTHEVARLISALGGNELTTYGLCHLGDYEATVFSAHSQNRSFGEAFIKGERYDKLAEGCYTVCALVKLGERCGVELPICRAVYDVLYGGADARDVINRLFRRNLKPES